MHNNLCKKNVYLLVNALNGLSPKHTLLSAEKDSLKIQKPLMENARGIKSCVQEIIPAHKTPKYLTERLKRYKPGCNPLLCTIGDRTTIKIFGGIIEVTDVQTVISLIDGGTSYLYLSIGGRLNEGDDDLVCNRHYPLDSPLGKKFTACINFFKKTNKPKRGI
jgi:hypothetical protein